MPSEIAPFEILAHSQGDCQSISIGSEPGSASMNRFPAEGACYCQQRGSMTRRTGCIVAITFAGRMHAGHRGSVGCRARRARYFRQSRAAGHPAAELIAVEFAIPWIPRRGAGAGRFRHHARLHMPRTSTDVPSNSSLSRKIFSFHGFGPRSKTTRWPASAPHRSM